MSPQTHDPRDADQPQMDQVLQTHAQELRSLTRRLVQVQEDERRALARDLHDTAGQSLTFLGMGLAVLQRNLGPDEQHREQIEQLRQVVQTTAEELRRLSLNLRPSALDRYGLVPAIEQLIFSVKAANSLEFTLEAEDLHERLPDELETAVFRIVQEACTNIARHAAARAASIGLHRAAGLLKVTVTDDGRGFDVAAEQHRSQLGLRGMAERAEAFGGRFGVVSSPGQGTRIEVEIPLTTVAAAEAGARSAREPVPLGDVTDATRAGELARAKALSDALADIMAGAAYEPSRERMLAFVLARSAEAIGCETANILRADGDEWVLTHGYRLPDSMIGQRFGSAEALVDLEILRSRQVVVVNDTRVRASDTPLGNPWGVLSLAAVPLVAEDELLGILNYAYHSAPAAFKPSEVDFLERLAAFVTLALENIVLRQAEARQADRVARQAEELRALFDVLPIGVGIATDPLCRDIRANRPLSEMLGLPYGINMSLTADEAVRPTSFRALRAGREVPGPDLPMQIAATTGEAVRDMVLDIERDDGKVLHLLAHAMPLFDADGAPRGTIGAFIDVTERQRSEAMLRVIAEHYPSGGVAVYDPELRFLIAGGEAFAAAGFTARDLIGKRIDEVYDPETVARLRPAYLAALAGESLRQDLEHQGRTYTVEYRPVLDDQGEIVAAMGASRDITERVQLEARLRSANAELAAQAEALARSEAELRKLAAPQSGAADSE